MTSHGWLTWSLALVGLLAGCAHTATAQPKQPECLLVTGSRIPRCPEPGSQVAPTDTAMRTYTREDLQSTGRDPNLGDALRALDPSVSSGR